MELTKEEELELLFRKYQDQGHELAVILDRGLSYITDTSVRYTEDELVVLFENYLDTRSQFHALAPKVSDYNILYPNSRVLGT